RSFLARQLASVAPATWKGTYAIVHVAQGFQCQRVSGIALSDNRPMKPRAEVRSVYRDCAQELLRKMSRQRSQKESKVPIPISRPDLSTRRRQLQQAVRSRAR